MNIAAAPLELTILMPCLNEAETLARCIAKAQEFLTTHQVAGEVLIADNGSSDGSPDIAEAAGARVVHISARGYGSALLGGIQAAAGRFVVMGDADDSYDFRALAPFLAALRDGADLVMGNRFRGGIAPGAMPPLHQYLGNPVLTTVGRLFFRSPIGDFHCGLRAFRRDRMLALDLQTTGMEFASEMVVKATLHGLRIVEVPTTLVPDGRSRPPHLRSWRDGWRHLRFLLLYSPRWLFLYPGLLLIGLGLAAMLWLLPGPRTLGGVTFDVHTLLFAAAAVIVGSQAVFFAVFSRVFAAAARLLPDNAPLTRLGGRINLERGLIAGVLMVVAGIVIAVSAVLSWQQEAFGPLDPTLTLRIVIPAVTLLMLGTQVILASFFLGLLALDRRH
jgi:hypothetical protein